MALLATACAAQAAYTVTIVPDGADVVVGGAGTLNTTGLVLANQANGCGNGFIGPTIVCFGAGQTGLFVANALSTPLAGLTNGPSTQASSGTGGYVIIFNRDLYLPAGYVSGAPLTSQSRYSGRTLAQLGLTAGTTFNATLPSGDTVGVRVLAALSAPTASVASIPTLSEYGLMAMASLMAMLGIAAIKRRRG